LSCSLIDPATADIYTLSLHDALPICSAALRYRACGGIGRLLASEADQPEGGGGPGGRQVVHASRGPNATLAAWSVRRSQSHPDASLAAAGSCRRPWPSGPWR